MVPYLQFHQVHPRNVLFYTLIIRFCILVSGSCEFHLVNPPKYAIRGPDTVEAIFFRLKEL